MIRKYTLLYIEFIKQNLKAILEYRIDFLVGISTVILIQLCNILFVWILFGKFQIFAGWSFYGMVLIYSLMTLSKALCDFLFHGLWFISGEVWSGNLEVMLLRPVSPLFHLIANTFNIQAAGDLLLGIIMCVTAIKNLNISITPVNIIMLLLFVISGSAIIGGINLITGLTCFYIPRSSSLMGAVFNVADFAIYPLNIFNKIIRVILTFIIPYAFVSYYPASYFLNIGSYKIALLAPFVAILIWVIGIKFWDIALKTYASAGA